MTEIADDGGYPVLSLRRIVEQNQRIAELNAEVADLKAQLASVQDRLLPELPEDATVRIANNFGAGDPVIAEVFVHEPPHYIVTKKGAGPTIAAAIRDALGEAKENDDA